MTQINPRTVAVSAGNSDNSYELILTNWGNRGQKQDKDNGSIQYPPVKTLSNGAIPIVPDNSKFIIQPLPSLAAIAIAPRSSIDRCILHLIPQEQAQPGVSQVPPTSSINQGFVNQGGILETEQILSTHTPLIGQLSGPIIIRAHPAHYFGDTYIPSGTVTPAAFGTAIPTNNGNPVWINPELRLLLFLTGRGALPPTQRAPLYIPVNYTFTGNTEELIAVAPVMGRRHIRVEYRADTGGASVRLTGTFHITTPAAGPTWATHQDFEVPLVSATALAANAAAQFVVDNPGISYLLIKSTAPTAELAHVIVEAFD